MAASQDCIRPKGSDICPLHPGHKVSLQCEDCNNTLVCQLCTTTDHKRHGFRELKTAVEERANKIASCLIEGKHDTRPALAQEISDTIDKLKSNKEEYQKEIEQVKQNGETLKIEIDAKTMEEVSRLEFFLKENNDMLTTHLGKIEQLQRKLDKNIEHFDETLRTGTDCLVYDTGAEVEDTLHINIPEMPSLTTSTFTPCTDIKHYIAKAFGEIKMFGTTRTINPPTDVASAASSTQAAPQPTPVFLDQPTTLYERDLIYIIRNNCKSVMEKLRKNSILEK